MILITSYKKPLTILRVQKNKRNIFFNISIYYDIFILVWVDAVYLFENILTHLIFKTVDRILQSLYMLVKFLNLTPK